MTLVAEETSAHDLNRRVEPDIPRRRYTPGAGWTRHVPNVLRSLLWAVAVFSAVTAVFPTGPYPGGLTRGNQASIVIPTTEENNPLYRVSDCDPSKA